MFHIKGLNRIDHQCNRSFIFLHPILHENVYLEKAFSGWKTVLDADCTNDLQKTRNMQNEFLDFQPPVETAPNTAPGDNTHKRTRRKRANITRRDLNFSWRFKTTYLPSKLQTPISREKTSFIGTFKQHKFS